jgi:hypothetical protein
LAEAIELGRYVLIGLATSSSRSFAALGRPPMIQLATGAVLGAVLAFAAVAGAGVYLLKRDEFAYLR